MAKYEWVEKIGDSDNAVTGEYVAAVSDRTGEWAADNSRPIQPRFLRDLFDLDEIMFAKWNLYDDGVVTEGSFKTIINEANNPDPFKDWGSDTEKENATSDDPDYDGKLGHFTYVTVRGLEWIGTDTKYYFNLPPAALNNVFFDKNGNGYLLVGMTLNPDASHIHVGGAPEGVKNPPHQHDHVAYSLGLLQFYSSNDTASGRFMPIGLAFLTSSYERCTDKHNFVPLNISSVHGIMRDNNTSPYKSLYTCYDSSGFKNLLRPGIGAFPVSGDSPRLYADFGVFDNSDGRFGDDPPSALESFAPSVGPASTIAFLGKHILVAVYNDEDVLPDDKIYHADEWFSSFRVANLDDLGYSRLIHNSWKPIFDHAWLTTYNTGDGYISIYITDDDFRHIYYVGAKTNSSFGYAAFCGDFDKKIATNGKLLVYYDEASSSYQCRFCDERDKLPRSYFLITDYHGNFIALGKDDSDNNIFLISSDDCDHWAQIITPEILKDKIFASANYSSFRSETGSVFLGCYDPGAWSPEPGSVRNYAKYVFYSFPKK